MRKCKFGNDFAPSIVQAVSILIKSKDLFPSIASDICNFMDIDFFRNKPIDQGDIRSILEKYVLLISKMSPLSPAYELHQKFLKKISPTMIDALQKLITELQSKRLRIFFIRLNVLQPLIDLKFQT